MVEVPKVDEGILYKGFSKWGVRILVSCLKV